MPIRWLIPSFLPSPPLKPQHLPWLGLLNLHVVGSLMVWALTRTTTVSG